MKIKLLVLLFSAFLFTSCTHTPTKGDEMMNASNHAKALNNQWEQGKQLASTGNAKHQKGLALIAKGNQLKAAGKKQLNQGRRLQQESETVFNEKFENNV